MQRQHHMLNSKGALSPQLSQRSDSHLHAWDRQPDFQRRLPSGRRPAGSVRKAAPAVQQVSKGTAGYLASGLCPYQDQAPLVVALSESAAHRY